MKITDTVREYTHKRAEHLGIDFIALIDVKLERDSQWSGRYTESPIEQIFLVEWYYQERLNDYPFPFSLEHQYAKEPITGKYILDFMVEFSCDLYDRFSGELLNRIPEPRLGIELDGHIWHEKTKGQVEYHKERERFLTSHGWKILRYAGSEVCRDAEKCVKETLSLAWTLRRQYIQALESAMEK